MKFRVYLLYSTLVKLPFQTCHPVCVPSSRPARSWWPTPSPVPPECCCSQRCPSQLPQFAWKTQQRHMVTHPCMNKFRNKNPKGHIHKMNLTKRVITNCLHHSVNVLKRLCAWRAHSSLKMILCILQDAPVFHTKLRVIFMAYNTSKIRTATNSSHQWLCPIKKKMLECIQLKKTKTKSG